MISKRKRRPAGTPDPDAEVVSLSPRTLLESDRYVCEICNQGFQRDQNLQMHRRRHKVPWKLLKRETPTVRKRVYVCPEPSCLHHEPCHALGDLVGIKKHFRRKHSSHKQWVCDKCSKAYAVQSDYKAHLKTCGTRGHSCDCGRVFSRVESFIEHQDACNLGRALPEPQMLQQPPGCLSRTASSPSPSSDTNLSAAAATAPATATTMMMHQHRPTPVSTTTFHYSDQTGLATTNAHEFHNLELQLLTTPTPRSWSVRRKTDGGQDHLTQLHLSIGTSDLGEISDRTSPKPQPLRGVRESSDQAAAGIKEHAREQLRMAMAEKAYAEEARKQAKRQIEMAEQEFNNAKRMRLQAQSELDKAQLLRDRATRQVNSTMLQITCHACKQLFRTRNLPLPPDLSYVSSAVTDGEVVEKDNGRTDRGKTVS